MQKSRIEWTDYTINPVKGLCPMACSYCYARRMYKRFHWEETMRYYPELLSPKDMLKIPDGSKVFVGSTMELFGDWVKDDWMVDILDTVVSYPKLTFIFLTKQPQNLIKWSPFPKNCWVGASATNQIQHDNAIYQFGRITAKVKFLSVEPLLSCIYTTPTHYKRINWLIIGQQTPVKMSTMPKIGWIEEIVSAADKAEIPVFLKNNLMSCIDQYPFAFTGKFPDLKLRQEFP